MEKLQEIIKAFEHPQISVALNFTFAAALGAGQTPEAVFKALSEAKSGLAEVINQLGATPIAGTFVATRMLISAAESAEVTDDVYRLAFPIFEYDALLNRADDGVTAWVSWCREGKLSANDMHVFAQGLCAFVESVVGQQATKVANAERIITAIKLIPMMVD